MHHYDHVPPGDPKAWKHGPYSGDIAHGLLWGRGSFKADSAAWLWALRSLKEANLQLKGDTIFTCVCDEENGGQKGFRYLLEKGYCDDADYMMMGAMGGMVGDDGKTITVACNERRNYRVVVRGRVAHTGRNEKGINAIVKAAKVIPRLQKLADVVNARTYQYNLPGLNSVVNARFSINVVYAGWGDETVRDGVISGNTVPDKCVIEIDRRITPGENPDQVTAEIQEVVDETSHEDPEFKAEVTWDPKESTPGSISPTDSPLAKVVQKAATRVLGFIPSFEGMSTSSDFANFTHKTKRPQVGYGFLTQPPGQSAHGPNEAFVVKDLLKSAKIYALTIAELLEASQKSL
jgi:acetylornithine deacetylase